MAGRELGVVEIEKWVEKESRNTKNFKKTLAFLTEEGAGSKQEADKAIATLSKAYADLKALEKALSKEFDKSFQEHAKYTKLQTKQAKEDFYNASLTTPIALGGLREKYKEIEGQKEELAKAHEALDKMADACHLLLENPKAKTGLGKFLKALELTFPLVAPADKTMLRQVQRMEAELRASPKEGTDRKFYQEAFDGILKFILACSQAISIASVKIKAYVQNTKLGDARWGQVERHGVEEVGYREHVNKAAAQAIKAAPGKAWDAAKAAPRNVAEGAKGIFKRKKPGQ